MTIEGGVLGMPLVWHEDCLLHQPGGEVWLQVSADGYRTAGELIGALGPVAAIQQGGYDLPSLGEYVLAALTGVAAAPAVAGHGSL